MLTVRSGNGSFKFYLATIMQSNNNTGRAGISYDYCHAKQSSSKKRATRRRMLKVFETLALLHSKKNFTVLAVSAAK